MTYERHPTREALVARAVTLINTGNVSEPLDVRAYTDNNGLTFRAEIIVGEYRLRWFAMCEESVDFMGLQARREANAFGWEMVNEVQNRL